MTLQTHSLSQGVTVLTDDHDGYFNYIAQIPAGPEITVNGVAFEDELLALGLEPIDEWEHEARLVETCEGFALEVPLVSKAGGEQAW